MNAPLLSTPALSGAPVLETERLILRAPHAGDVEAWIAFDASPRSRHAPSRSASRIERAFSGAM